MSKKASVLKGKVFEWFVSELLKAVGFLDVPEDNFVVYNGAPGKMIHGLGQSHNADVLMSPPFQTPVYFPSRILVECKGYKNKVGLPEMRNVLGLREDINHFEVLTPDILQGRRNNRRPSSLSYPYNRYHYQVAFATTHGVGVPAQEFALAHRIPLIPFYGSRRYDFLRDFISGIDEIFCSRPEFGNILSWFTNTDTESEANLLTQEVTDFINKSQILFDNVYLGLLENGEILFLHADQDNQELTGSEYRCTIHWQNIGGDWEIRIQNLNQKFFFQLPTLMYDEWIRQQDRKREALNMKERDLARIVVFRKTSNRLRLFILNLNSNFIRQARRELLEDEM